MQKLENVLWRAGIGGVECRREYAWDDNSVDRGVCCGRGGQGMSQNLNDGGEGRGLGFYA